jgi:hypothetical protein
MYLKCQMLVGFHRDNSLLIGRQPQSIIRIEIKWIIIIIIINWKFSENISNLMEYNYTFYPTSLNILLRWTLAKNDSYL